jgi:hypothetical protein
MDDSFSEMHHEHPFYHAIGNFVATMSYVDFFLVITLLRMISPGETALTHASPLVAGSDFRVKLAMVRNLLALHGEVTQTQIVKDCGVLQELYERRNIIAHGLIGPGPKAGSFNVHDIRLGADGRPKPRKTYTVENLKQWNIKARAAILRINNSLNANGYPALKQELDVELMPLPVRKRLETLEAQPRTAPPTRRRRPSPSPMPRK